MSATSTAATLPQPVLATGVAQSYGAGMDTAATTTQEHDMDATATTTATSLTPRAVAWLRSALAKVNGRAERLHLPPFAITVTDRWEHRLQDGVEVDVLVHDATVTGGTVALAGGWRLVGVVDLADDGVHLVRTVPGVQGYPAGWHHAAAECDHCQRRGNRARLIGVVNEAGEHRLVGTTCCKGYLGFGADHLAWYAEALEAMLAEATDSDDEDFGGTYEVDFPTAMVLDLAQRAVQAFGWRSRAAAASQHGGTATADHVLWTMNPHGEEQRKAAAEVLAQPERPAYVAEALAWLATTDDEVGYLANLRIACARERLDGRTVALAASLLGTYERHLAREQERALEAEANADAEPVPAGRMVVTGTVVSTGVRENDYGVRYVMTVRDERGFRVWGTQPAGLDVERGDTVQFTATLERSTDDATFGYFKRPTKAQVLTTA